jgi:hypothetical protein
MMVARKLDNARGPLIAAIIGLILIAIPIVTLIQMFHLPANDRGGDLGVPLTAVLFGIPGLAIGIPGLVILTKRKLQK